MAKESFVFLKVSVLILALAGAFYYVAPGGNVDLSFFQQLSKCFSNPLKWFNTIIQELLDRLLGQTLSLHTIRAKLIEEETKVLIRNDSRIAIGFGACTDLIVDSIRMLQKISPPNEPKPHFVIESMQQFAELYAYYFKHGAAAERYIKSKHVFNELLRLINESGNDWTKHIGGNGPLMSLRFAKEGVKNILLGAQMSSEFANQLPKSIQISGPIIERDDYHILLEYKTDDQWGPYKSPRANRLIVHSDDNNVQLVSRLPFFEQMTHFDPDLLIISALQMMENSPVDFEIRSQSIDKLALGLHSIRQSSDHLKIHFELASYTENRLLGAIVDNIFPLVDSFGMNEQEAANLLSFLKYGNISYVSNSTPRIAIVLDQMRELLTLLDTIDDGRISRIHVHTLAYQVVVVKLNSTGKPIWPYSSSAMAKASLTAYRHTCVEDNVDISKARILLDDSFLSSDKLNSKQRIYFDEPTKCWTEMTSDSDQNSQIQFCISIGIVCTKVIQTGGAGDNVSAAGLVLQI